MRGWGVGRIEKFKEKDKTLKDPEDPPVHAKEAGHRWVGLRGQGKCKELEHLTFSVAGCEAFDTVAP